MEDDGKEYWRVHLTSSNTIVQVLKAKFVSDKDGGRYIYPRSVTNGMRVTQYWPVRMKFNNNGIDNWCVLLNRVVYDDQKKLMIQLSS